jgi:hypothetical protein
VDDHDVIDEIVQLVRLARARNHSARARADFLRDALLGRLRLEPRAEPRLRCRLTDDRPRDRRRVFRVRRFRFRRILRACEWAQNQGERERTSEVVHGVVPPRERDPTSVVADGFTSSARFAAPTPSTPASAHSRS